MSLRNFARRRLLSDFERGVIDDILRLDKRTQALEAQEFLTPAGGTMAHIKTFSGTFSTADFTNIPAIFKHLKIIYSLRTNLPSAGDLMKIEVNGATSGYDSMRFQLFQLDTIDTQESLTGVALFPAFIAGGSAPTSEYSGGEITFFDYANTGKFKEFHSAGSRILGTTTGQVRVVGASGVWKSTAAINRLEIQSQGVNPFQSASIISLYGIS